MNEYEYEPVRGLPEELPEGEELLWQGEPQWRSIALHVFHARKVAIYFALLMVVHTATNLSSGETAGIFVNAGWYLALGGATVGLLVGLAWLYARSTIYTLTNQRLVLRFGVAIPMMINLPLSHMVSADLRRDRDGNGDIALTLKEDDRFSYWALWPHARPWHFAPVKPMLRGLAQPERVAGMIVEQAENIEPSSTRIVREDRQRPAGRDELGSAALS